MDLPSRLLPELGRCEAILQTMISRRPRAIFRRAPAAQRYNVPLELFLLGKEGASVQMTTETVTIDEWVKQLSAIPVEDFTIPYVHDFASHKRINPDSLAPYLFYAKSHYTRNLIYRCELFE